MALLNVFEPSTTKSILNRLEKLSPETQPQWGKMNVAQMLAHLNIAYDMAYGKISSNNGTIAKFFIKLIAKKVVVGEKPYPKNSRTAPIFVIADEREFETEKARLKAYVLETEKLGVSHFEGKESDSFGPLTSKEWSILFYKHLNHHFEQFGV